MKDTFKRVTNVMTVLTLLGYFLGLLLGVTIIVFDLLQINEGYVEWFALAVAAIVTMPLPAIATINYIAGLGFTCWHKSI